MGREMILLRNLRGLGVGRGPDWVLLLLAAVGCHQASPTGTPSASPAAAVPVYQERMHRLVYRSPLVRILDVRIAPGETTAYHIHSAPLVVVAVQDARTWAQTPGAEINFGEAEAR